MDACQAIAELFEIVSSQHSDLETARAKGDEAPHARKSGAASSGTLPGEAARANGHQLRLIRNSTTHASQFRNDVAAEGKVQMHENLYFTGRKQAGIHWIEISVLMKHTEITVLVFL